MVAGKKGEKALSFGTRLKYPIKITKLYKSPGDVIRRQEPILQYSFEYSMELPQNRTTLELQIRTLTSITDWNAPEDGTLLAWNVRVGDVITQDYQCVTVEEACTHEIQFQGLCALCGKDMNEVNWANEQRDTERAPINMTHDQTNLTVSHGAATRAENDLQQRLLAQRKLSLVVDLDQTIIHACIDPTIGEWQQDPGNPNYAALQDVRRFQLEENSSSLNAVNVAHGCWYYIKMRPGLADFLATISTMYELHVYTMGTRTYATNIARIVDPDQKLFGNRVISRDENGNIVAKSLQRLFPVSTHMAVIIDDRADVWPYNRQNLIKVTPYDFFKGTGDINSSFLPKPGNLSDSTSFPPSSAGSPTSTASATANASKTITSGPIVVADGKEAVASPASTTAATAVYTTASSTNSNSSIGSRSLEMPLTVALAPLAPAPADDCDTTVLQRQAEERERTIEQQIKDRPLLHMQEMLDKEDKEAAKVAAAAETETSSPIRHCVLVDDDNELTFLTKHLTELHHEYYNAYDKRCKHGPGFSRSNLAFGRQQQTIVGLPDVGMILGRLKSRILEGTTIVLSGLVPLGMDVERSEIGLQVIGFGANLQRQISKKVTHLVVSSERPRTLKVRQAARFPTTKIVNQNWLLACFSQWEYVDETPYLAEIHPADRSQSALRHNGDKGQAGEATDTDTMSDADSEDFNGQTDSGQKVTLSDENEYHSKGFDNFDEATGSIAELGMFDWGSADDELEMFLAEGDDEDGDDNDDNDMQSVSGRGENNDDRVGTMDIGDNSSLLMASTIKRKHGEDRAAENSPVGIQSRGRSLLRKRQKLDRELATTSRSRSLSRLHVSMSARSFSKTGIHEPGHPLKQDINQTTLEDDATTPLPAKADSDDELEAELMAELEKEEAAAAAEAETSVKRKENGIGENGG